jgi:hypothetical protein
MDHISNDHMGLLFVLKCLKHCKYCPMPSGIRQITHKNLKHLGSDFEFERTYGKTENVYWAGQFIIVSFHKRPFFPVASILACFGTGDP